jgi:hypothetical protein
VRDQRLTLSFIGTALSRKSAKFATVIAGPVLAVTALTAAAAAPSHPARPLGRPAAVLASAPVQPSPQQIARKMLRSFGWSWRQFRYLNWLWDAESSWNAAAVNPSTGAYGIPQAVPGSKMSSAGPDWQTDTTTQIRWGLTYISETYGSPRSAWDHEVADGWY